MLNFNLTKLIFAIISFASLSSIFFFILQSLVNKSMLNMNFSLWEKAHPSFLSVQFCGLKSILQLSQPKLQNSFQVVKLKLFPQHLFPHFLVSITLLLFSMTMAILYVLQNWNHLATLLEQTSFLYIISPRLSHVEHVPQIITWKLYDRHPRKYNRISLFSLTLVESEVSFSVTPLYVFHVTLSPPKFQCCPT